MHNDTFLVEEQSRHMPAAPFRAAHCATSSPAALTEHVYCHYSAYRVEIDGVDNAESVKGCIDILELPDDLAVHDDALIVTVEGHVPQVRADDLLVPRIAVVVQELINDTAALRQDAVSMSVPAVVIDGVENVVCQLVRSRSQRAGLRRAAGECADGVVDDVAHILAECCE